MTDKPPQYTGTLKRGEAPGSVVGEIRDRMGWVIRLTGARTPNGSYVLEGRLGETPSAFLIEGFDEAEAAG